jgi:predicted kinase
MSEFAFEDLVEIAKNSTYGIAMQKTVEDSPWHREANTWVHTMMTLEQYEKIAHERTAKQQLMTRVALLFHDFGKPEAEKILEKKDQPGVFYRSYAGHEPISANEFINVVCDDKEIRDGLFKLGLNWLDIRAIKLMIEHHLPYGLKNVEKLKNLRRALVMTLENEYVCFYDMLRSDSRGRISDNHAEKLENVENWINDFDKVDITQMPRKNQLRRLTQMHFDGKFENHKEPEAAMILLVGPSGVGKTTYIRQHFGHNHRCVIVSEDDLRIQYAEKCWGDTVTGSYGYNACSDADRYREAWNYCHMQDEKGYKEFAMKKFMEAFNSRKTLVVDRMNHNKKGRNFWVSEARRRNYHITSVEFYASEKKVNERQQTRTDKFLPPERIHAIMMAQATPLVGSEVDSYVMEIV